MTFAVMTATVHTTLITQWYVHVVRAPIIYNTKTLINNLKYFTIYKEDVVDGVKWMKLKKKKIL